MGENGDGSGFAVLYIAPGFDNRLRPSARRGEAGARGPRLSGPHRGMLTGGTGTDIGWQATWHGSSCPVSSFSFGDCDWDHNLLTKVQNRGYNAPQIVPASLRREAGVTHDVLRHDLSVRRFLAWKIGPLSSLLLSSPLPPLRSSTKAAGHGCSRPMGYRGWRYSGFSPTSSRTSSLTSPRGRGSERACASAERGQVWPAAGFNLAIAGLRLDPTRAGS